jgi:peroxiredoxin
MSQRLIARTGLTAAILTLTLSMGLLARQAFTSPPPPAEIGKTAPAFNLPTTDGQAVSLASLRGQAVVLFFGSDACPQSQRYAQQVLKLAQSVAPSSQVRFLAINSNTNRIPGTSPTLLNASDVPTLLDPMGQTAQAYGATVTPTFCVIDAAGILRYAGSFDNGSASPTPHNQFLARALEHTLEGTPVAITSTQSFGQSIFRAR